MSDANRAHCNAVELTIFARFHAQPGCEQAVRDSVLEVVPKTRQEPGCLAVQAYRSTRDAQTFFIHSRWRDEAAFELHAGLPHTVRFIARVETLIDHPLDIRRAEQIG